MTGERELAGASGGRGAVYRRIGVEPIVNGSTTMTRLGGSLMPAEVVEAMRQAAECFVDLVELQEAVGRRIAVADAQPGCVRVRRRGRGPVPRGNGVHGP